MCIRDRFSIGRGVILETETVRTVLVHLLKHPVAATQWKYPSLRKYVYDEDLHLMLILMTRSLAKDLTPKELEEIAASSEQSPFIEVYCEVLAALNDHRRAFVVFMTCKNRNAQAHVFEWLDHVLGPDPSRTQRERALRDLKEVIQSSLKDLVSLNSEKTQRLISVHFKNEERGIIKHLDPYPQVQAEYLERALEMERARGGRVDNELLVMNVRLLCRLNPRKLKEELRKYDYPLDQSVKICREFGNKKAVAFLLDKSGAAFDALELYLELFEAGVKLAVERASRDETKDGSLTRKVARMIEMGQRNTSRHEKEDVDTERLWFRLFDGVVNVYQKLIAPLPRSPSTRRLRHELAVGLSDILENISQRVSIDTLVGRFTLGYGNLALGDLSQSFARMFANLAFEVSLLRRANRFLKEDISHILVKTLNQMSTGHGALPYCEHCQVRLRPTSKLVVLKCGHVCHKACFDICGECPRCANDESARVLQFIASKGKLRAAVRRMSQSVYVSGTADANKIRRSVVPTAPQEEEEERKDEERERRDRKEKIFRKMRAFDERRAEEGRFRKLGSRF
eukprot:TRINITY_DN2312_c0_g2_i2.p1 TRINITY_DN2312_c0_g2~~TRINITY_DN2312_c0_g2_i2.p1  ORF type:complete len:569 (-),score=142.51 TRINITY_DN2312_c0_g2_i2:600-2306(-)